MYHIIGPEGVVAQSENLGCARAFHRSFALGALTATIDPSFATEAYCLIDADDGKVRHVCFSHKEAKRLRKAWEELRHPSDSDLYIEERIVYVEAGEEDEEYLPGVQVLPSRAAKGGAA